MVNIAKRMRSFQPLLQIQYGKGAAVLPPAASAQLTRLILRYPQRTWSVANQGPRLFAKDSLPRLKYHNPVLPIQVEESASPQLELTFESANPASLEALQNKPWEGQKEDIKFKEEWTEIKAIPLPAADASSPSSTSPRSPVFTRNARLDINGQRSKEIWRWFQKTTSCSDVPVAPEDADLRNRLQAFFQKAEIDRRLVKAGVDEMNKQKEELKKAREAAERLTSDS